jgi:hypothetical protein
MRRCLQPSPAVLALAFAAPSTLLSTPYHGPVPCGELGRYGVEHRYGDRGSVRIGSEPMGRFQVPRAGRVLTLPDEGEDGRGGQSAEQPQPEDPHRPGPQQHRGFDDELGDDSAGMPSRGRATIRASSATMLSFTTVGTPSRSDRSDPG